MYSIEELREKPGFYKYVGKLGLGWFLLVGDKIGEFNDGEHPGPGNGYVVMRQWPSGLETPGGFVEADGMRVENASGLTYHEKMWEPCEHATWMVKLK